jgi:SAM-dependent methyltransferase
MTEDSTVWARAAAFYEKALRPTDGCRGAKANAFTQAAGYIEAELKALPADAVGNSFGCGNPLAFAGVRPGQTVLDLGCGAGIDLLIAAQRVGPSGHVIGVDVSDVMLERARANVARVGATNIELRQGEIETLPVEGATVDWVISNCVINLSPDKTKVFREIHRVLKIGGHVLVSDMIAEGLPDWIVGEPGLHGTCLTGALSERDYLNAVCAAGLGEVIVVGRLTYDDGQLHALIGELLPASLESLGASRGRTKDALLEETIAAISGCVQSVKISASRPA